MSPTPSSATSSRRNKGPSKGVKKTVEPAPSKILQSQRALSLAATAASLPAIQHPQNRAHSRQPYTGPQTRAQSRKLIDERRQSQKRSRSDPSSGTAPAVASRESAVQTTVHQQRGKRRRVSDDEPPSKRHKPSATPPLSTENLERLQSDLGVSDDMETATTPAQKNAPSRQVSSSDLLDTASSARSQKSAGSLKFYRYDILARFGIYIQHEYPPTKIKALLEVIFQREISKERKDEISHIAQETAKELSGNTRGGYREDDFLETLDRAFCKMFPAGMFKCPRKTHWNPSLKPDLLQKNFWDLKALHPPNNDTEAVVDRPSKRQQPNRPFPSPSASQPASQSPVIPPQTKQDGAVKNPRPDCTFGHHHSTYTHALEELGLQSDKADSLLEFLQEQQKLLSDPTMDYVNVRFPILTLEGKAYATGRTAFEAENQAAVSGACMVNLQQQLIDLYESILPGVKGSMTPPFAFSMCTEGPLLLFWVHYALTENGIRRHYMKTLYVCDGALDDMLEIFLRKWEQLMGWYGDEFLKETAGRLYDIANRMACSFLSTHCIKQQSVV